jgi:hypothetical protein
MQQVAALSRQWAQLDGCFLSCAAVSHTASLCGGQEVREIGGEANNEGWGGWGLGMPWIVDVRFIESPVSEVANTEH